MINIIEPLQWRDNSGDENPISSIKWVIKYEQHGTIRLVKIQAWTDEHNLIDRIAQNGINPDGIILVRPGTEWRQVDYVAYIGHAGIFKLIDNVQLEADLPTWSTQLVQNIKLKVKDAHGHHGHNAQHHPDWDPWKWRWLFDWH
jgi:hypothetical protein